MSVIHTFTVSVEQDADKFAATLEEAVDGYTSVAYSETAPDSVLQKVRDYLKNVEGFDFSLYEYRDNYRVARLDYQPEVLAYAAARVDGCCGSYDTAVTIDGVQYLFGFNYGH